MLSPSLRMHCKHTTWSVREVKTPVVADSHRRQHSFKEECRIVRASLDRSCILPYLRLGIPDEPLAEKD